VETLDALVRSTSGKELVARGFACDVQIAAEYAVSAAAPVINEDRFVCGARLKPQIVCQ